MGHSVKKSVWIMYAFSIFIAVSAIAVAFSPNATDLLVLVVVILVFILMGRRVGMVYIED